MSPTNQVTDGGSWITALSSITRRWGRYGGGKKYSEVRVGGQASG